MPAPKLKLDLRRWALKVELSLQKDSVGWIWCAGLELGPLNFSWGTGC